MSFQCPGSDHPGPSVTVGRNAPEIDVLEAQIDPTTHQGQVSQSFQVAPFNYQYQFDNTSPAATIYNSSITAYNTYMGGQYQQAVSAVTDVGSNYYNDVAYTTYGYEWWSDPSNRDQGYITWYAEGQQTWKMTPDAVGPDSTARISGRLIPEEPMVGLSHLCPSAHADRSTVHDSELRHGLCVLHSLYAVLRC